MVKPSVQLHLIKRRAKKGGKYPVKIRVIYDRKPKDYPIGLDLLESEFNGAMVAKPKKDFRDISQKLKGEIVKANKIVDEMGVFTFQKFQDLYYGRLREASNIYSFFESYIDELIREERIKTAKSYESAKSSFQKYKPKLGLYDITPQFLNSYHFYQKEKGISNTSIGIYVRSLRTIYNYAIALGVIKKDENYPFGKNKYVIPAGRNIKKALTSLQIKAIYNYPTIPGTQEDKARDFWMFSYLCNGINFKDIALLRLENVDGNMLRFVRAKTKHTTAGNPNIISCFLNEPAKKIIEKWGSKAGNKNDFLFSILNHQDTPVDQVRKTAQFIQTTNKYLKKISEEIGLGKPITTYYSRHSAATTLKHAGASIEQIQEALGHQSSITTQKYLDSFDDESKKNLSESLTRFL